MDMSLPEKSKEAKPCVCGVFTTCQCETVVSAVDEDKPKD